MAGRQLDFGLLGELVCPVCSEYMASAIRMCENGHNICGGCKDGLSECPSCRGNFLNVRNITLERIAATVVYPCKNVRNGCNETFTLDNKDSHLADCLFQSRECPFRKLFGFECRWTGTLSDIPVHILAEHQSETVEVPAHFRVELLDFVVGNRYRKVVIYMVELFYLTWKTEGDILGFGVLHFGPKNETDNFKYGTKIGNSDVYVAVTRKCHSYLDGGLEDIQPRDWVLLHSFQMQERIGEQWELSCEIEIGKWKLDGFVSEDILELIPRLCAVCNSEPNSGSRDSAEVWAEERRKNSSSSSNYDLNCSGFCR
jgi:E3 ubiquitin-protein ligase SIAH1